MTKLNKLDNIEATIGDLSLSMEQLKTESAQVKTEVGLMKSEIKELKEKKQSIRNKSLRGFHLARQNLMRLTGLA